MINLDNAKYGVRNYNWPKIIAENPINNKENTTDKINNPDFSDIFQYKTENNKKRGCIPYIISDFRRHWVDF